MDWILFTPQQREEALERSETIEKRVCPRLIDNPDSPKHGLYAAPDRIVQADYTEQWADFLTDHERYTAEPSALFIPME